MNVYILRGVSGSGKSTKRKELCRGKQVNVISYDEMRTTFYKNYSFYPKNEAILQSIALQAFERFLTMPEDVIIDNTNLNPHHVKLFIDLIKEYQQTRDIKLKWIDLTNIPLKTLLANNKTKSIPVDENIIKDQFSKLSKYSNFYDELEKVDYKIFNDITKKDKCAIFDLDGTLALAKTRSYKDQVGAIDDVLSDYVYKLYKSYPDYIIICTARPETMMEETLAWLELHEIAYDEILFREKDDTRSDHIVKQNMWEIIARHYYIDFIVDDRLSVTNHARKLGLNVLSVNNKFY